VFGLMFLFSWVVTEVLILIGPEVLERNSSPLEDILASSASFLSGVITEIGLQFATTICLVTVVYLGVDVWCSDMAFSVFRPAF